MSVFTQLLSCSDQVVYHSIMTLIHRAIPPTGHDLSATFSTQCIQAARSSLRAHLNCAMMYKQKEKLWAGYMKWYLPSPSLRHYNTAKNWTLTSFSRSILNIPFTPFMVHVITLYPTSDLDLLASFVASLKPAQSDNSEGIDKLYRLCDVFYQVAKLYVEAKAQEARTQAESQASKNLTAGSQHAFTDFRPETAFDPYLSMLGFAPNQAQYLVPNSNWATAAADVPPGGMDLGNGNIQDWFSGNSNIMGLLDQDIDYINMAQ
jgi:hypothetical protein